MPKIAIPFVVALVASTAWAVDTHNGVLWQQVVVPPKPGPCYVPTNQDYRAALYSIGYEALHDSVGPAPSLATSKASRIAMTSSKGCLTFPYLGDPYDKDGSLHVNNWVHAGIDLRADTGDSVYAVGGGTVVWTNLCIATTATAQASERFCKAPTPDVRQHSVLVVEDFSKTRKTFYLHMSEYSSNLVIGQQVCKGQYLGTAGSVGTAASHLHIEVWPSSAPGYSTQTNALSGGHCPGKQAHKLADGSTRTAYCEESDIRKYTIDPSSSKISAWRELELGQSGNEIEFRRINNDAVALFRGQPVAKCLSGSDFVGPLSVYLEDVLAVTRVMVSPASPTGKYLAVFCSGKDSPAQMLRIVDRSTTLVVRTISPSPTKLFQILEPWITFSPDDHFAVLNQSGDEGNYAPIALDLVTGVGKTFAGPLVNDEQCPAEWSNAQTFRYRATQVCDAVSNPSNVFSCKSLGIYEYSLDLPSTRLRRKRIADWQSY